MSNATPSSDPIPLRSSLHLAAGRSGVQLLAIASALVLPNILGVGDYGLLAGLLALVAILEVLASGGLQVAEIRFVAPAYRDQGPIQAMTGASTIWWSRASLGLVAGGAAGFLVSRGVGQFAGPLVLLAVVAVVVGRTAAEASRHLLLSVGRTRRVVVVDLTRAAIPLLSGFFLYTVGGLSAVVVGIAAGYAIVAVTAMRLQQQVQPVRLQSFSSSFLREVVGLAAVAWVGVVAWTIQSQIAVIVVGEFVSYEQAAVLAIGVQAFVAIQSMMISARSAGLPDVSHRSDATDDRSISEWIQRISLAGLVVVGGLLWAWRASSQFVVTLLPAEMAPITDVVALMVAATGPLMVALVIDGALFAVGEATKATSGRVVFGLSTVIGLIALSAVGELTPKSVAYTYIVAGFIFLAISLWNARRWQLGARYLASASILFAPTAFGSAGLVLSPPIAVLIGVTYLVLGGTWWRCRSIPNVD